MADEVCETFRVVQACDGLDGGSLQGREFGLSWQGDPPCGQGPKEGYPVYRTLTSPYSDGSHDWLFFGGEIPGVLPGKWFFTTEEDGCSFSSLMPNGVLNVVAEFDGPLDPTTYDGEIGCWYSIAAGISSTSSSPFQLQCLDGGEALSTESPTKSPVVPSPKPSTSPSLRPSAKPIDDTESPATMFPSTAPSTTSLISPTEEGADEGSQTEVPSTPEDISAATVENPLVSWSCIWLVAGYVVAFD